MHTARPQHFRSRAAAVHVGAALIVLCALGPRPAAAVVRSCVANALTNTANVLCASPSGPCNSSTVTVSAPIDVTSGGCKFDLGGRAVVFDRTFEMVGTGFIEVVNAGNITITDTGKLKARGDYNANPIVQGGTIVLNASGTVSIDGDIDVGGDPAGAIAVQSVGTITLLNGSTLRGIGVSSASYADGGVLTMVSTGGNIVVNGSIVVRGEGDGTGGDVTLQAARNIDVDYPIDAAGGGGGGGTIDLTAGDDLTVTRDLEADSQGAGGSGGDIVLAAGVDDLGGIAAGGALTVDDSTVKISGSSGDGGAGDGGELSASARGPLLIGSDASLRIGAGGSDASAGYIWLNSGDNDFSAVSATDGDLTLYGVVHGTSGDIGGWGGDLTLLAGRDLTLDSDVDLGGKDSGGSVAGEAGRNFVLASPVLADATSSMGSGGSFSMKACDVSLTATSQIDAVGEWGGQVNLIGRRKITVNPSSGVDASGWWGSIRLVTKAFGTCSNAPTRNCLSNVDCVVGCNAGTCLNLNPDTGGTTSQFSPAPEIVQDSTLISCP